MKWNQMQDPNQISRTICPACVLTTMTRYMYHIMVNILTCVSGMYSLIRLSGAAVLPQRQSHSFLEISWFSEDMVNLDTVVSSDETDATVEPTSSEYPFVVVRPYPSSTGWNQGPVSTSAAEVETTTRISTSFVIEPPKTITFSPSSAATITEVVTVTVSEATVSASSDHWTPPVQFTDLDSFKIVKFADGQSNLELKNLYPQESQSTVAEFDKYGTPVVPSLQNTSNTILQLAYPANSSNPGNFPVGGVDFYATPMKLDDAKSVSLEYTVFFPSNFDWVKGGKLPGLYGGHTTCSGGDDATSCFSTRLMWREHGAGELYLYAPKNRQTDGLCRTPPFSYCDASYGLSIGRGSFNFTPGGWTRTRQTVTLNTPGKQDGHFQLEIDGEIVISRTDVFYRDNVHVPTTSSPLPGSTNSGGLLSPLLGDVLDRLDVANTLPIREDSETPSASLPLLPPASDIEHADLLATDDAAAGILQSVLTQAALVNSISSPVSTSLEAKTSSTITITSYVFGGSNVPSLLGLQAAPSRVQQGVDVPIGFTGLFFSTFFGGNSKDYATPFDQFTWFKDFAISINAFNSANDESSSL